MSSGDRHCWGGGKRRKNEEAGNFIVARYSRTGANCFRCSSKGERLNSRGGRTLNSRLGRY